MVISVVLFPARGYKIRYIFDKNEQVLVFCYRNCSEHLNCFDLFLEFEAEGRDYKILKLLEKFIQVVKGQKNFW